MVPTLQFPLNKQVCTSVRRSLASVLSHSEVCYSFHIEKLPHAEADGQHSRPETALREWWTAYPAPLANVPSLDCDDVATLVKNANKEDYVVIDVRRADRGVSYFLQVTSLETRVSIFH